MKWKFDTLMAFGIKDGYRPEFNCSTGKWTVKFYDDDEMTEVYFPDKDVRVVNK